MGLSPIGTTVSVAAPELNPHGPLTRCLRFSFAGRPAKGKTRYRPARYSFSRTGLSPVGFFRKVSSAHMEFSSPKLCLARYPTYAQKVRSDLGLRDRAVVQDQTESFSF